MSLPPTKAFLVFSGFNLRAVVAFCRALQRAGRGFRIIACTPSDPIFTTSWRSAVAATREREALDWDDIARCIRQASDSQGIKAWFIAPSSEFFIRWALERREMLAASGCSLPLPDRAVYLMVSDKRPFSEFCRRRGLRVPAEFPTPEAAGLPCVAKPVANVTSAGTSLYPWLLRTPEDLAKFRAATPSPGEYFFQEWVEGESVYLLLHLDRQGPSVRFSQRNLAQQPGGKSVVLAEPAMFHLTAEANDWEDALRAAGFFGLVMVELRVAPACRSVLIEANPRLWGPLQLTVDCCPPLLEAYFDDILGPLPRSRPPASPTGKTAYLWWGGARETWGTGGSLTWHMPPPKRARWKLLRRIFSDVYLRRDTFLWFWRE